MGWLKTALDAAAAPTGGTPGGQQTVQPTVPTGQEDSQQAQQDVSPIKPAPTPTTGQNAAKSNQQQAQTEHALQVSIPTVAQEQLGTLNQNLGSITDSLMRSHDMHLSETAARRLAVEIVAEWVAASRNGNVSQLANIIANSKRMRALAGMA